MVLTLILVFVAILTALYFYGRHIELHPERYGKSAGSCTHGDIDVDARLELLAADHERATAEALVPVFEDVFARGFAMGLGAVPRSRVQARMDRRAAPVAPVEVHDSAVSVDLDAMVRLNVHPVAVDDGQWWRQAAGGADALTGETVVDDAVTEPITLPGWGMAADSRYDAVRCADGRVKASLVLGRRR